MAKKKTAKVARTKKTAKPKPTKKATKKTKKKKIVKVVRKAPAAKPAPAAPPTRPAGIRRAIAEPVAITFSRGDAVRVTSGIFNGIEGTVTQDGPGADGRVDVSLDLGSLGCQPRPVAASQLERGGSGPCGPI